MEAPDYKTCYDFSVIETAVESLAAASPFDVAWLAGANAVAYQKSRPRIECYLDDVGAFSDPQHYVNTADGNRRCPHRRGMLRTMILTPTIPGTPPPNPTPDQFDEATGLASYQLHWEYRSFVDSILETVDAQLRDNAALLPYHQVARCWPATGSSKIAPQTGYYLSQLNHNITFSIRPSAWPAAILNA